MSEPLATRQLPAPMRVGEILDRSFPITLEIAKRLLPLLLVSAILAVIGERDTFAIGQRQIGHTFTFAEATLLQVLCKLASAGVGIYTYMLTVSLGADLWCSVEPDLPRARKTVTFMNVISLIMLFIWMAIIAFLFFMLLVIPGIVYSLNRFVSQYILLIEDLPVGECLSRSKELMQHNPGGGILSFKSPKWRLTGVMIVGFIVNVVPALFLGGAITVSGLFEETISLILLFVLGMVASLTSIFSNVAYEGFYFDLRSRFEGGDLAQAIDRLKREPITS